MDKNIMIKTPQYEIEFSYLCEKEYKKINGLLNDIENEFGVSMSEHQELRSKILDVSNFIKRLPSMVSEVI